MYTEFLNAELGFKNILRDDAYEGGATDDLEITISYRTDTAFEQKTTVWCVTETDIDNMIAELKLCKSNLRDHLKLSQKLEKTKKAMK